MDAFLGILSVIVGIAGLLGLRITLQRRQTWRDTVRGIRALEPAIRRYRPEIVIGISDGIVPAAIIATNFNMSICLFLSMPIKRDARGSRLIPSLRCDADLTGKRILLVDNHLYSGANMKAAVDFVLSKQPAELKTATIFRHVHENAQIDPDYFAFTVKGKIKRVPWSLTQEHFTTYYS